MPKSANRLREDDPSCLPFRGVPPSLLTRGVSPTPSLSHQHETSSVQSPTLRRRVKQRTTSFDESQTTTTPPPRDRETPHRRRQQSEEALSDALPFKSLSSQFSDLLLSLPPCRIVSCLSRHLHALSTSTASAIRLILFWVIPGLLMTFICLFCTFVFFVILYLFLFRLMVPGNSFNYPVSFNYHPKSTHLADPAQMPFNELEQTPGKVNAAVAFVHLDNRTWQATSSGLLLYEHCYVNKFSLSNGGSKNNQEIPYSRSILDAFDFGAPAIPFSSLMKGYDLDVSLEIEHPPLLKRPSSPYYYDDPSFATAAREEFKPSFKSDAAVVMFTMDIFSDRCSRAAHIVTPYIVVFTRKWFEDLYKLFSRVPLLPRVSPNVKKTLALTEGLSAKSEAEFAFLRLIVQPPIPIFSAKLRFDLRLTGLTRQMRNHPMVALAVFVGAGMMLCTTLLACCCFSVYTRTVESIDMHSEEAHVAAVPDAGTASLY